MAAINELETSLERAASLSSKLEGKNVENVIELNNGLSAEDNQFLQDFPPERRRKVLRKVDLRLLPLLTLFYIWSYLDRANIGNAAIEGLPQDLKLTGTQYNTCLAIFFIPYVLLEIPSNYILDHVKRPSVYMGAILTGWGAVMTLAGVTQNFAGLFVVRFFLGVFEAGFYPGAIYIIGKWYLPYETQTRISVFYSAAAISGAFSGLLAAGITQMNGIGGLKGWRWIFIIEGLMTVASGIACFWLFIDTPALSGKWLDADEIRYLELRQQADPARRASKEKVSKARERQILWTVFTDWQIYLQALSFWGISVPNNGLKFSMPSIIKNMGFSATNAQLLTVPPYIVGAIATYISALFADRVNWRMPFLVVPLAIVIIAYAILFATSSNVKHNIGLSYFSVVLACIGIYPLNPATSSWTLNNLAGPTKRSMGIAFMICMGNIGGVVGSYIFIANEAPRYPTGYGSSFAFAASALVAVLVLEFVYKRINAKRAAMTIEEIHSKYTEQELEDMGDRSPLFRYSL